MGKFMGALLGPLAGPECRRAAGRGWLILVRTLAACAYGSVVLVVAWWWWANATQTGGTSFQPYQTLRVALIAVVGLAVAGAMLMTPALLAGSLAGDRDRQAMGMLLTTRVNSLEIVLGRLAGKYSQVASVLLAGVPTVLFLGWMAGWGPAQIATAVLYPAALALGAAGVTAGASSVSRRGRDALLGTYLVVVLLISLPQITRLIPSGGLAASLELGLAPLEPFAPVGWLALNDDVAPAWTTAGLWLVLGTLGTGLAVWRLRPNCLRWLGGEAPRKRRLRRRGKRPPVADRPMFWKEVYIERGGSIAGFAQWLGYLAIIYLAAATTILGGRLCHELFWRLDSNEFDRLRGAMHDTLVDTSPLFSLILTLAVGLRAAVAIATERERNTWDGLLTSPLEGKEIVWGKLWGSVLGLRWLLVAMLYAWGVALAFGAMSPWEFFTNVVQTTTWSAFLAAMGVRMSLTSATATSSMAKTIGIYFGTRIGFTISAWILVGVGALLLAVGWMGARQAGLAVGTGPWFPIDGPTAAFLFEALMVVSATFAMASETAVRFDRLAGRMASGGAGLAIDRLMYGGALEPVLLDGPAEETRKPEPVGAGEL